jgi:hypothetical protein
MIAALMRLLGILGYPLNPKSLMGGGIGLTSNGIVANKSTPQTVTNTTTLTNTGSITLPAVPVGGGLRVSASFSMNNNANVKQASLVLGGTTIALEQRGNVGGVQFTAIIRNRGSQASQWITWQSFRDSGAISGGALATTIDLSVPQTLGFWCGPLVAGADYITFDGATVETLFP